MSKPSDGLEPSTPSLPWKSRRVTRVHVRSSAASFLLQIRLSRRTPMRRAASCVSFLMCPFCVRVLLTGSTTGRWPVQEWCDDREDDQRERPAGEREGAGPAPSRWSDLPALLPGMGVRSRGGRGPGSTLVIGAAARARRRRRRSSRFLMLMTVQPMLVAEGLRSWPVSARSSFSCLRRSCPGRGRRCRGYGLGRRGDGRCRGLRRGGRCRFRR